MYQIQHCVRFSILLQQMGRSLPKRWCTAKAFSLSHGNITWVSSFVFSVTERFMHTDDVTIFEQVTKLLWTCTESGLAEPARRRRAVACMNTISALVTLLENEDWASLDFFDDGICGPFSIFSDPAIVTAAFKNVEIRAAKLQRDIKAGLDKEYPSSWVAMHSLAMTSTLKNLYKWGSLDPIIDEISNPRLAEGSIKILC